MYKIKLLFIIALSLITLSCSKQKSEIDVKINNDVVTVGTFNIAWLGDGIDDTNPRSDEEYKIVADIIQKTGFEIIGLEEIENAAALKRIMKFLPGYDFKISEGEGKQNVAVIYRNYISLEYVNDYLPIAVERDKTRPGMFLKVRKGNFDWYMMVVHFKSTSRYDDTPEKKDASIRMRTRQAEVMSNWADSVLTNGSEKDLIMVGDFNDFPERKGGSSLAALIANPNIKFLTAGMTSCKNEKWYVIDHVLVSQSAKTRFIDTSIQMENFRNRYPKEVADKISDHCPIGVAFEITSADND